MYLRSKRFAALGVAVATALAALTGASVTQSAVRKGPPPMPANLKHVLAQVKGKSLAKREAILYNQAKKEGTVNWYTTLSKTIGPDVVKAFEAKYPGVKVDMYRASSEAVTARLYQEASAGATGADVVETNGTELLFMQHRKNILVPYRQSPYAKWIAPLHRYDTWTADRIEAFITAWNTNLVKSGEQPKSWRELGTSKWAGKIAMEPGDVDWWAAAYQSLESQAYSRLSPKPKTKKARLQALKKIDGGLDQLWRAISKNAQIVSGHTTQATLLAAGQFALCVSCHAQSIEALQMEGAPISFKPWAAPAVIRAQGVALPYRLAHPAAAVLFYDWLLRKDGGQKALLDGGANPARIDMTDPQLSGGPRINMNLRPIVSHYKKWLDRYDALMQLGSKK